VEQYKNTAQKFRAVLWVKKFIKSLPKWQAFSLPTTTAGIAGARTIIPQGSAICQEKM
jgi:hypothetical protein